MMTKVLSCALALAIVLSGCGSTAAPASQSETSASSSSSSVVVVSDIGVSHDEIVGFIDARNSKNGYATIAQSKKSETVAEAAAEGEYLCTRYILMDGITAYFWMNPDTLAVRQFTLESSKKSYTASSAQLAGYMYASLPFFFEPDEYEQLTSELKILTGDAADHITVEKAARTYIYNSQKDKETLTVIPPQGSALTVDSLSFADVGTLMSIDTYLDTLLPNMKDSDMDVSAFEKYTSPGDEPGYIGREYSLGTETVLMLFESETTGEIDEVFMGCNVLKANESAIMSFGYVAATSLMMFEDENYETVSAALQLGSIQSNDQRFVSGTDFEYFYSVDSGQLGLTMLRRDSEQYNRIINSD